ncbi:MAG: hypothetical protein ACLRPU_15880 [Enterococcus hulanensis]
MDLALRKEVFILTKDKIIGASMIAAVLISSILFFNVKGVWMIPVVICVVAPMCLLQYDRFIKNSKSLKDYFYAITSLIYLWICYLNNVISLFHSLFMTFLFLVPFVMGITKIVRKSDVRI